MWHLIFRRCEPDQYPERKTHYESVGIEFESSWAEGADSKDNYPHVHNVVYSTFAKKTLQDRLSKRFPQYSSLHVFKDVDTPEYQGNLFPYVCKEWNPLITTEEVLQQYEPFKGVYNFNLAMRHQAKPDVTVAKNKSFNQVIVDDFEVEVKRLKDAHEKRQYSYKPSQKTEWTIDQINDKYVVEWLIKKYKVFRKDLDHTILMRKFWVIKTAYDMKKGLDLSEIVMTRLNDLAVRR